MEHPKPNRITGVLATLAAICIPLMVSSLSFSSSYGELSQSIKQLNLSSDKIIKKQDHVLAKLTSLEISDNLTQQDIESLYKSVDKLDMKSDEMKSALYCMISISPNEAQAIQKRRECVTKPRTR